MSSIVEFMIETSPYLKMLYFEQEREQEEAMANGKLKSVGSLWKGHTKDNGVMLSGFVSIGVLGNDVNIMIFPNKNKKADSRDPDYFVSVKVDEKQDKIPLPPKNNDDL